MAESIKKKYIETLGLDERFTQKELDLAYKNSIRKLAQLPDLKKEYFIEQVMLYNTATSVLSHNSIVDDLKNAFTEKTCNILGITLEEAKIIFERKIRLLGGEMDFNSWLKERTSNQELYEDEKENIIRIYSRIPQILLIRYDKLVTIYEGDKELSVEKITFSSWIEKIVKLCEFIIKSNTNLVIENEYSEYINDLSLGTSFLTYLENKIKEMNICKKLNITYYSAKHKYDFEVSGMSFREYLEGLLERQDLLAKLNISKEQFTSFYSKYKEEGYTGTDLDFLRELEKTIDYCIDIDCGYFILKKRYESLPDESKPQGGFEEWLILEKLVSDYGGYVKMLSDIYVNQVKKGFTGTITDLFKILTNIKPIEEEIQSEPETQSEHKPKL